MKSAGIVLLLSGAFVLYAVLHGRLASASPWSSPAQGGGGGGGGGSGGFSDGGGGGDGAPDSGTHSAIDLTGMATGVIGAVYSIASDYGSMTDQQKADANAYANQIGNVDQSVVSGAGT